MSDLADFIGSIAILVEWAAQAVLHCHSCGGRNPEHRLTSAKRSLICTQTSWQECIGQRNLNALPIGKTMAIIHQTGFWVSVLWIPASAGMTTTNSIFSSVQCKITNSPFTIIRNPFSLPTPPNLQLIHFINPLFVRPWWYWRDDSPEAWSLMIQPKNSFFAFNCRF